MAVFTEVPFEEAAAFLRRLGLGELRAMAACQGGIENTNYFVDTDRGEYVLTLFERLTSEQLPFYLHLMQHLAGRGMPVPRPAPDAEGHILHRLRASRRQWSAGCAAGANWRPAPALRRSGRDAGAHAPGRHATMPCTNPTCAACRGGRKPCRFCCLTSARTSAPVAGRAGLPDTDCRIARLCALPRGPIHADLFRDNVMFEGGSLSGFLDFYFAGCDTFLFDIGVCLNDWCVDLDSGRADAVREAAFLTAYESVRPLVAEERRLLPALRRAAALRFWLSRL